MARPPPTAELLRTLYSYDPETGQFTRLTSLGGARPGTVASHTNEQGYVRFSVKGVLYRAHRLAWLYVHGSFPVGDLDHIDGDRANNRISNLRECNDALNAQNAPIAARSDNKHGYRGVSFQSQRKKWQARIMVGGRSRSCGLFDTPEEAYEAYLQAKANIHPFQADRRAEAHGSSKK